jgi:YhcH/YjgK/YiaL family protein
MILDTLANRHLYSGLNPRIVTALDYLARTDLSRIECGKHTIDGSALFLLAQEYETRPMEACNWEAHHRYIDVQFVMKGTERMGYSPLSRLTVKEPYSEEKDFALFAGNGDFFDVHEGMFVIFMPDDAHMPGVRSASSTHVRKMVLKVLIESDAGKRG